jgi:FAD/FMN-containing dehydrogenase
MQHQVTWCASSGAIRPEVKECDALLQVMRDIKARFDPNGILNPYKFLPPP